MSTTVAALRGKLGSTEYFIVSMPAKEVADKVDILDREEWKKLPLEEREQRDIDYNRVKRHIAPYLAHAPDRFFGAIIVAVKKFNRDNFLPLTDRDIFRKVLNPSEKAPAAAMGFLTFDGGEEFHAIDGQHRLKAIEFAIKGRDERGQTIPGLRPSSQLAADDVTVILIAHERKKARNIFTKVNRYAKSTTTGQNLIIDDDDIVAVLARELANDEEMITPNLVAYKGSTLSINATEFTTLATIAGCCEAIILANFPIRKIDRTQRPTMEVEENYRQKVQEVWKFLLKEIRIFADALSDRKESGDDKRIEIRQDYMLGKPVPQVCLVKAFVRLTNQPTRMSFREAAKKLNAIPWKISDKLWDRLLWSGKSILTKNAKLATDIIAYMAGEKLTEEDKNDLLKRYRKVFSPEEQQQGKKLPDRIAG